jgi:hypothetical protein
MSALIRLYLPIGAAIALSSALMLLGWPMAWLAFGLRGRSSGCCYWRGPGRRRRGSPDEGQPPAGPPPMPGSVIAAGSSSSSSRTGAIPCSVASSRIVRPLLSASLASAAAAS